MSNNNYPKISDLSSPILDAIPDMFVLCDKDTTVLDILHPKEELLSGRVKDLTGCRLTDKNSKQVFGIDIECFDEVLHTRNPVGLFSGIEGMKVVRRFITKFFFLT